MPQDKDISEMTAAELRIALAEYARNTHPSPVSTPLPPGITADMSPKAQDTASALYAETIMRKPAGLLTQAERDFLRGNINSALRDMGY